MLSPSILATAMVIFKVLSQGAAIILLGRGLRDDITAYARVGFRYTDRARRRKWVDVTSINGALMLGLAKTFLVTAFVRVAI